MTRHYEKGHTLLAYGEFDIKQGDDYIVRNARNKLTGQCLRHIVNLVSLGALSGTGAFGDAPTMRVGTGTGATGDGTTALVAENATAPSSVGSSNANPTAGVYQLRITATWNAGAIAAIAVTEIGVKSKAATIFYPTLGSNVGISTALFARLSTTDGEFTGFTIDTTKPLVIEYRFVLTFA